MIYSIELETPKLPKLKTRIRWTPEQSRRLADAVLKSQLARYDRAEDSNDQPHKPLSDKYRTQKERKGRRPVRDMKNTGNMLRGLAVQDATETGFAVGFAAAHPKSKRAAYFRQLFDGFFGMSPRNNAEFDEVLEGVFAEQLRDIWETAA